MIRTKENDIFVEKNKWIRITFTIFSMCLLVAVPLIYKERMSATNIIGWSLLSLLVYSFIYYLIVEKLNKEKMVLVNGVKDKLKLVDYEESIRGRHVIYYPIFYKEGYGKTITGISDVPYDRKRIETYMDVYLYRQKCVVMEHSSWKCLSKEEVEKDVVESISDKLSHDVKA